MLLSGFQFSTECATPAQLGSLIIYMLPSGFQFGTECTTPAQLECIFNIFVCNQPGRYSMHGHAGHMKGYVTPSMCDLAEFFSVSVVGH